MKKTLVGGLIENSQSERKGGCAVEMLLAPKRLVTVGWRYQVQTLHRIDMGFAWEVWVRHHLCS